MLAPERSSASHPTQASGATIRFETTPVGALVIMGTETQRQKAWMLINSVQATLPKILSQIRENEIRYKLPTT